MSMTGVGEPPMCSDWCHICNVSTLDIHSVGTQLKLLLAPQECKWDQLCVQVCKCEQQLEVVGLPVPCASATTTGRVYVAHELSVLSSHDLEIRH